MEIIKGEKLRNYDQKELVKHVDKLLEDYNDESIGEMFGVSKTSINALRISHKLDSHQKRRGKRIEKMWEDMMTDTEISSELNCDPQNIRAYRKSHGMECNDSLKKWAKQEAGK